MEQSEKPPARHEAGLLKQLNKLHKTGRHRSKRSISNDSRGKTMYSVKTITKQSHKLLAKVERRNQAKEKVYHCYIFSDVAYAAYF